LSGDDEYELLVVGYDCRRDWTKECQSHGIVFWHHLEPLRVF
jgi:hypothetical protein